LSDAPFYVRVRYPGGRVNEQFTSAKLSAVTGTAFFSYAVTPSVDVTVMMPASRISFRASSRGSAVLDTGELTTKGIGDLEARAKWAFWHSRAIDLAAEYGIRLPTGAHSGSGIETGAGRAQQRLSALVSARVGEVRPHVNVGYAFRVAGKSLAESLETNFLGYPSPGAISNEAFVGVGAEWGAHPRLTVTADFLGRWLKDNIRFEEKSFDRDQYEGAPPYGYIVEQLMPVPADIYLSIGATGAKYRVAGHLLATAYVLFPLSSSGLRPGVTTVVGWEYGF
jgi:hypothetical protein